MNVEDPGNIRVIRVPALGGIALALRDCAKVDRDVPTDLQRLLERLNNNDRPNREITIVDQDLSEWAKQ